MERLRLAWREPLDPERERWGIVARSLPPPDAPPGHLAWSVLAPDPSLVTTGRRAWAHYQNRCPEGAKGRLFSQKPERPSPQALATAGLIVRHLRAVRDALVREKGLPLPDDWAEANVPGSVFWAGETLDSIRRAIEVATGRPLRWRRPLSRPVETWVSRNLGAGRSRLGGISWQAANPFAAICHGVARLCGNAFGTSV